MKTTEQIGREVIEANYGINTEWGQPNEFGEQGFTRAQAESDIDSDEILGLIESAIQLDRDQRIQVGDIVEHIDHPELDPRQVIAVGDDWLWLDVQRAQLSAGALPVRLPLSNYRRFTRR